MIGKCELCGRLSFRIHVGIIQGDKSVDIYVCKSCFKKLFFDHKLQSELLMRR